MNGQPSGSQSHRKQPDPVCLQKMNPFFQNLPSYRRMAQNLSTDADFLMALSSMESGWLAPHSQGLHKLFGVTKTGGNDPSFSSYQAAADYWVLHFGSRVTGAKIDRGIYFRIEAR